ncbi:MAG: putative capsid protein [Cressdnaviricota sp.]|nr:MAG: putative capsid protein [Cressdnaviricota sp.]
MPTQLTIKESLARPKSARKAKKRVVKRAASKRGLNTVEKKQVKDIISAKKEFKYCPNFINYDYYDPALQTAFQQPITVGQTTLPNVYSQANNTCTIVGFQMGKYANTASQQLDAALTAAGTVPCMNQLGGIGMENGIDQTNIIGDYALLHSSKVNFQINTSPAGGNADNVQDAVSPMIFRVIHVSCKQDQAGITPSLSGDLFRDMTNENKGLMSDMTLKQLMTDYSLNRERFHVHKDFKFKLSEPTEPDYAGTTANQSQRNISYPTQKNFSLWMPKPKKKLRFSDSDNGSTNAFEWLNADFVSYVFVLCCREQNTSGNYSSTLKRWTCSTQGQTKYRDV